MSATENPPAFPRSDRHGLTPGMTLRDYFAGQALSGLAGTMHPWSSRDRARRAYEDADAMLAERAKGQGQ